MLHALAAYGIWGLIPLYFIQIQGIPPIEFIGWRIVFTVPICLVIVVFRRQFADVRAALVSPRLLVSLVASASLIASNWLIYILAIQNGHVFAASLAYYINPLVNVLAGTILLKERMSRLQWLAVLPAALGIVVLAWNAGEMLQIAMLLALTFCGYGIVRKLTPVGAVPGLTVETIVLLVPALGILSWYSAHGGVHFGQDPQVDRVAGLAGLVTAVPLLLFAVAARRMPYSTLGFMQFLTPTVVFVLGLFYFGEPLDIGQLASFGLIWGGVGLFMADLALSRRRTRRLAAVSVPTKL